MRPVFIGHLPKIYGPMRGAKTKVIMRKKNSCPWQLGLLPHTMARVIVKLNVCMYRCVLVESRWHAENALYH